MGYIYIQVSHSIQGQELIGLQDAVRSRKLEGTLSILPFLSILVSVYLFHSSLSLCLWHTWLNLVFPSLSLPVDFSPHRQPDPALAQSASEGIVIHYRNGYLSPCLQREKGAGSFQNNMGVDLSVFIKTPQDDYCPAIEYITKDKPISSI